jgi:hypothetical protein
MGRHLCAFLSIIFVSSFSTSFALGEVVAKEGDMVYLSCPFLKKEGSSSSYFPVLKVADSSQNVDFTLVEPSENGAITLTVQGTDDKFKVNVCPSSAERDKCTALLNTVVTKFVLQEASGYLVIQFTVSESDGGRVYSCDEQKTTGYLFPEGATAPAPLSITFVDLRDLILDVNPKYTDSTKGIVEFTSFEASCQLNKTGPSDVSLDLTIDGEEGSDDPIGVSALREVDFVKFVLSTDAKKRYNGKKIVCSISDGKRMDSVEWAPVESAPLNVLFAPYDVMAEEPVIVVEDKQKGEPAFVNVSCSAKAGNPPTFQWSAIVKDTKMDKNRDDLIRDEIGKGENFTIILRFEEEDFDVTVKCAVENKVGEASAMSHVKMALKITTSKPTPEPEPEPEPTTEPIITSGGCWCHHLSFWAWFAPACIRLLALTY